MRKALDYLEEMVIGYTKDGLIFYEMEIIAIRILI